MRFHFVLLYRVYTWKNVFNSYHDNWYLSLKLKSETYSEFTWPWRELHMWHGRCRHHIPTPATVEAACLMWWKRLLLLWGVSGFNIARQWWHTNNALDALPKEEIIRCLVRRVCRPYHESTEGFLISQRRHIHSVLPGGKILKQTEHESLD